MGDFQDIAPLDAVSDSKIMQKMNGLACTSLQSSAGSAKAVMYKY